MLDIKFIRENPHITRDLRFFKKTVAIAIILAFGLSYMVSVCAEEVILKSGKTLKGSIIEKNDEYIKIDLAGVTLTLFLEEIQSIDGQTVSTQHAAKNEHPIDYIASPGISSKRSALDAECFREVQRRGKEASRLM